MAAVHLVPAAQNAAADAIVDLIDAGAAAGTIKIYDGTMPADASTAVSTQTLLATLTFSDPAFGDASSGVATASSITSDTSADATGTASWARIADSDGTTVADVDVGESGDGATVTLNTTAITAGGEVALTAFTFTMPDGTA
jgi:hypothetical protein